MHHIGNSKLVFNLLLQSRSAQKILHLTTTHASVTKFYTGHKWYKISHLLSHPLLMSQEVTIVMISD